MVLKEAMYKFIWHIIYIELINHMNYGTREVKFKGNNGIVDKVLCAFKYV